MQPFDASRVHVEYRDGVTRRSPLKGRKYTVTHSDDTGELYVTVGLTHAIDKVGPLRDEVFLDFELNGRQPAFYGTVLIDSANLPEESKKFVKDSQKRTDIFLREMPIALRAIRSADRQLFEQIPKLDTIPVYIWFQSDSNTYNKLYDFGTMADYKN